MTAGASPLVSPLGGPRRVSRRDGARALRGRRRLARCHRRRRCSPRRRFVVARGAARACSSSLTMLALAQYWNLLAGYAGLVFDRTAGLCWARRLCAVRARRFGGLDPLLAILIAGAIGGACRRPRGAAGLPPAGRLFRDRHLGGRGGVPAGVRPGEERSAGAPGPRCQPGDRRTHGRSNGVAARRADFAHRAARDSPAYWLAVVLAVGTVALVYGLCARVRAWRLPPSATTRRPRARSASTRSGRSCGSMSSPASARAWSAR